MGSAINTDFVYVDSENGLRPVIERMETADRLTIDTEADSLHSYYEKVCLIQLAIDGEVFLVDPLAGADLGPFLDHLAAKPLILHGAEYDLRMLRSSFGFRPRNAVFDTVLAAQLLGFEQFGLAALVQRFFDVALPKSGQRSDWSRRPLSDDQLRYAADDTRFLEPIANLLAADLDARNRTEWHREWCERMVEATGEENRRDPEHAWRIKGLRGLDRRQLAFVREIWRWREQQAQRADRPPFKIMPNPLIVELAEWAAKTPDSPLEAGPRLPRHCRGRRLEKLKKAVARARRMDAREWPALRKPRKGVSPGPEPTALVDALRAEGARIAGELGIAPSVLAPRAALVGVARRRPGTLSEIREAGSLMRWQAQLLESSIRRLLQEHPPQPM